MIDTGIPWIGQVPEGWKVGALKYFAEVFNGREIQNEVEKDCPNAIPVFGSGGVFKFTDTAQYSGEAVLFGRKGTIGKPLYTNGSFATVDTMYYSVCDARGMATKYFYYLLTAFDWSPYATHTAVPSMVASDVFRLNFCIPPLPTQRAIAAYLDGECGKIDALRTKIEAQIADLSTYKKSVITEAVTGKAWVSEKGIVKNEKRPMKPSGVEWIGDVPAGWKVISLKHLYDHSSGNAVRVGPFGSSMSASDIIDEGVWVYNQRAVLDNNFKSNNICVSKAKAKELESFAVEPGDVLITTRGTIGKIAIVPMSAPKGILHPCIIRFRINEDKVSKFFLRFIFNDSDLIENQIKCFSNSTTIDVVYSYTLKELKLPIPPLAEQREIAAYLDEKCAAIDAAMAKCREQLTDLASYKKSLIYECVTGKKGL